MPGGDGEEQECRGEPSGGRGVLIRTQEASRRGEPEEVMPFALTLSDVRVQDGASLHSTSEIAVSLQEIASACRHPLDCHAHNLVRGFRVFADVTNGVIH